MFMTTSIVRPMPGLLFAELAETILGGSMSSVDALVELQQTLYRSSNLTRRWLHCARLDWIVDALQRAAPEGRERALEIGPGAGIYLPVLARLFREVVASDIETAYLQHAAKLVDAHPNLHLVADDITASKLPEASFDLILCTEFIRSQSSIPVTSIC
jgi:16S rRNA A1518/A1519 N6-dimethyltransferase RsmA/KsgA/DIM1 with predicted DNA glycosylase/AP lyase activity